MKPDSAAFRSIPALLFAVSLATAMLAGCGATNTLISPPSPMAGFSFEGHVHGGQQPVSGAQIELFAAGIASGLNANATSLLQSPVFTDSTGYFSITGDYTCLNSGAELYLMALGGNPGLASGTDNSAIVLVAPLGQCGNLTANTHVILNEVTTVATAYALAGSIGNNDAISYDPNAQAAGMAIDQSNNVWIANDGTDSIVEMDSQGFILTPPSGLYGGGLDGMTLGPNYPFQVAVDPNGNVWTTNMNSGTVSEFSSNRTVVGGYLVGGNPVALFIDSSDSLWVAQPPYNEIEQLDGVDPVNGYLNLIDNPEVNDPAGMAVDPSGNLWIANFGSGFSGSVTELVGIATPTKAPLSAAMQTRGFLL